MSLIACGGGKQDTAMPGTGNGASASADRSAVIAVFIPGVIAGSPTYEMLADGVTRAADEYSGVEARIIEGGFNQGDWPQKITALAAGNTYDLIVTSNPAMPGICDEVSRRFPDQKFLILDGYLEGNPSIHTFRYNQKEQGFLAGHFAALISGSGMPGTVRGVRVGIIAGQEYPDMNLSIRPGFEEGVRKADPEGRVDFRVVGNWYDAAKAGELANSMFDSGVDVILTISGGASQGVVTAARERDRYVLWFDMNGYDIAPGTIIGSTAIRQEQAAYEKTIAFIEGNLPFGSPEVGGVKEGWVYFVDDDDLYQEHVPRELRERQSEAEELLGSGAITLTMPH